MQTPLSKTLIVCLSLVALKCTVNPIPADLEGDNPFSNSQREIVQANNTFGLKLFRELNTIDGDKNLFLSPLSVSMALGMLYNGANGATKEAMETTLGFSGLTRDEINAFYKNTVGSLTALDPKVSFTIANSIWYRQGFDVESNFINLAQENFDAEVDGLDFRDPFSVDVINTWVDDRTNGTIKEIVEYPINAATVMFLLNAIYFKGGWTFSFDRDATVDYEFYRGGETFIPCLMMGQKGYFNYYSNDLFSAIDLPYGDEYFSMTLFLPRMRIGVDSLVTHLTRDNWKEWINSFKPESCDVFIPKFKLACDADLNEVLKAAGMGIAFTDGADFSGISKESGSNLMVSEVKHKTYIDVNEEGTVAGGVTCIGVAGSGPDDHIKSMLFERPFLFVIRENRTQSVLFIGKIVEPVYN